MPLTEMSQAVASQENVRQTGRLNVAKMRLPDAVIDMNIGRAFGSGGMSQKIDTDPSPL
jgi:hypothetical protein